MSNSANDRLLRVARPTPPSKQVSNETSDAGKPGADENAAGFLQSDVDQKEDEDADPVGDGAGDK